MTHDFGPLLEELQEKAYHYSARSRNIANGRERRAAKVGKTIAVSFIKPEDTLEGRALTALYHVQAEHEKTTKRLSICNVGLPRLAGQDVTPVVVRTHPTASFITGLLIGMALSGLPFFYSAILPLFHHSS